MPSGRVRVSLSAARRDIVDSDVYTACQASNPQLFNACLQRAMSHIKCMPWKGDILKYDREEEILADIKLRGRHALMQLATVRGQLGEHLTVAATLPLTNVRRQ